MKKRALVLGIFVVRTVIAVTSLPQNGGQENVDCGTGQERYAHRVEQCHHKSPMSTFTSDPVGRSALPGREILNS